MCCAFQTVLQFIICHVPSSIAVFLSISSFSSLSTPNHSSLFFYSCHIIFLSLFLSVSPLYPFFCIYPGLLSSYAFSQNKNSEFCAPLTSFDWNETDPNLLAASSIDTTCTIWALEVRMSLHRVTNGLS